MRKTLMVISTAFLLSGCVDDGVPKVANPHSPKDAKGMPISGMDFLRKYCVGKTSVVDCAKVQDAVNNPIERPLPKW